MQNVTDSTEGLKMGLNKPLPIGEAQNNAKLTSAQVYTLRSDYKKGLKLHELAKIYGVTADHVRRIVKLELWKQVS